MGKKPLKYAFFFVILFVLCLSSCVSDEQSKSGKERTDIPAVETRDPIMGGEVIVGIAQDLNRSLDPHTTSSAGQREVLFNIYEGLVKPDSDGELYPAVAQDYMISEDGKVFTFTLRDGIKFHDGTLVTTDDVVYSIRRLMGDETNGPLMDGFGEIISVEAVDDKTVVIKIKNTDLSFIYYLTAAIIPEHNENLDNMPIGTGPFKFISRSVQENIILEKNEDYWGTPAFLDKVTFQIIENADALVMSLKSGAIDLCVHLTPGQVNEFSKDFTVKEGTMNLVQAVYLNNAVKPLNDIRVRQALNYAIDIQAILDLTSDGRGTPVGSSMYPAFKKYYIPELVNAYPYDTDKAKALLTEAGYPKGFDLTITVPSNYTQHVETAQVVAEQLKAIGINVELQLVEWATWLDQVYQKREYEATVVGFDARTLTAGAMLNRWVSDSSKNISNFESEEYDQLILSAENSSDEEEQTNLYRKAETLLSDQAVNIYLQDLCDLVVMRKNLDGYTFYPLYVIDMAKVFYWE